MTIVVETGTGTNANANSYVAVADAKTWATSRGRTFVTTDDAVIEQFLLNAMDYLEARRADFKGSKLLSNQPLQWPRQEVYIENACDVWPAPGALPKELIAAQIQLAVEQDRGVDLMPTQTGPFIVREKIDVIETEYSEKFSTDGQPLLSRVEAFLKPLLNNQGSFALSTVRV